VSTTFITFCTTNNYNLYYSYAYHFWYSGCTCSGICSNRTCPCRKDDLSCGDL